MQDFYEYILAQPIAVADPPLTMVMTEAQYDELFELMERDDLPEDSMSPEMADGYMTACAIGPHPPPTYEWLAEVFAQPTLPICRDMQAQERLLQLLLLRMRDIHQRLYVPRENSSAENIFFPLRGSLEPGELIVPYTYDEGGLRQGRWELKDWAQGFRSRVFEDVRWGPMVNHPEHIMHLVAVMLYEQGYNSEKPHIRIEDEVPLLGSLIVTLHHIRLFWSDWRKAHPHSSYGDRIDFATMQLPYWRETPKVGRNDPCSCGSGKKYKKCCGA
jgi:uncharacterized protein